MPPQVGPIGPRPAPVSSRHCWVIEHQPQSASERQPVQPLYMEQGWSRQVSVCQSKQLPRVASVWSAFDSTHILVSPQNPHPFLPTHVPQSLVSGQAEGKNKDIAVGTPLLCAAPTINAAARSRPAVPAVRPRRVIATASSNAKRGRETPSPRLSEMVLRCFFITRINFCVLRCAA